MREPPLERKKCNPRNKFLTTLLILSVLSVNVPVCIVLVLLGGRRLVDWRVSWTIRPLPGQLCRSSAMKHKIARIGRRAEISRPFEY